MSTATNAGLDIICFYAEMGGGASYVPLIERMTASARKAMPDARVLLMAPEPFPADEIAHKFDKILRYPDAPTADDLIYHKGRAFLTAALGTKNTTVFVDPDVEFLAPVLVDDSFDIGLTWRKERADQPALASLLVTKPNQMRFWLKFGHVLEALPKKNRRWYCEQIALALMTGVCHKPDARLTIAESRVWLMDALECCAISDEEAPRARAIHYKGRRKGPEFHQMFPENYDAA